jgi:Niemann-Pick C2 protein
MNAQSIVIMFALVAVSVVLADPIKYKDCGSKGGISNINMDVADCAKFPCIFHKNGNASVTLTFTANQQFPKMTNVLYGIIAGVKVPFPTSQADACANGLSCPVQSGATSTVKISIPVLSVYPSVI